MYKNLRDSFQLSLCDNTLLQKFECNGINDTFERSIEVITKLHFDE